MAKFRIDSIAGLARQMAFTPHETRKAQLVSAEDLLHSLDPSKAYPFDFVVFRITGYHPKTVSADLLIGAALQHDLGLMIEQVSEGLDLRAPESEVPVLSIDDVTEKFNVTSKTIQRWRRRGLPARRFVFADGKRRVGFLLSSVERFLSLHQDQVLRSANFTHVESAEREDIIRRARRLAIQCNCCRNEIARRIARKLNRSPLTILHTIKKHDEANPEVAIFRDAPAPMSEDEKSLVIRRFKKGVELRVIARRMHRNRTAVYRAIVDERLARLEKKKIKFIDDPLYHEVGAEANIDSIVAQEAITPEKSREELRIPRDLPAYLADLYRVPLLTAGQERGLFLKLNFRKYQFVTLRRKLDPQLARCRELDAMEASLAGIQETRNAIVRANLRLVVSIARRHLRPGLNLMELISDGNVTLMRAAESFDIHRNTRFSTYATLALMKGFARSVPTMLNRPAGTLGREIMATIPDTRLARTFAQFVHRDQVQQMLSGLEDRERNVLRAHYGLDGAAGGSTYEQVGRLLGMSKQRVRKIEEAALNKLRLESDRR